MDGLIPLLILLAVGVLTAGPLALLLTLILFSKVGKLEEKIRWLSTGHQPETPPRPAPMPAIPPEVPPRPEIPRPVMETPPAEPQPKTPVAEAAHPAEPARPSASAWPPAISRPSLPKRPAVSLEQKIGTKILPIAAIITVIVGVGLFLKYLYDKAYFGPEARVWLVAVGGLAALIIGEVTRRRNYEIVAKGTTALGFALLYAAVFSASRVYMLIEMQTAFILAIIITAGAMAYAVALNEVIIAFLSLLGGYLSPIIISTGQNLAVPLFSYLLALAVGALGCAMFRRWRAVNWIALVGTWLLYTGWFEKFYTPSQLPLALSWLGVFGGLFLLQPILYGLKQKVPACAKDVGLIVINSAAVFYYLWRMLNADHPQAQAMAAAVVGAVHLVLAVGVRLRCREDEKLQSAMGVLGTAFVTTAIPLYFAALNPTLLSWSVEAVALTYIGIRYRSVWTKAMALLISAIAAVGLFYHLPLHGAETFKMVLNTPFGTWVFVAAAMLTCHSLWRFMTDAQQEEAAFAAQVYYIVGILLLTAVCVLEWYAHCRWQIAGQQGDVNFLLGMMVLAAGVVIVCLARPLPPAGQLVRLLGVLASLAGAIFVVVARRDVYTDAFRMFANLPFAITILFIAAMMAGACFIRRLKDKDTQWMMVPSMMVLSGLVMLWIVLSQEVYHYWSCRSTYAGPSENWRFLAQMYMSVTWAIYGAVLVVIGFAFRARGVRYLSLAIFAVLLGKVFLNDLVHLRVEYRFAAFVTTGLVLLGVSFVYQFLKKKGFFEEKQYPAPEIKE